MSLAQAMAMKFELAHAVKTCRDQATKVRMLLKMAALEEKIKAEICKPPVKRSRNGF